MRGIPESSGNAGGYGIGISQLLPCLALQHAEASAWDVVGEDWGRW